MFGSQARRIRVKVEYDLLMEVGRCRVEGMTLEGIRCYLKAVDRWESCAPLSSEVKRVLTNLTLIEQEGGS